jgi:DNA-binding IclR family transcriptional regulator
MAVIHEGLCWVFEFKVVDGEAEGTALAQIRERGYDRPHREAGLEVICVGVEFSQTKRQIVAWDIG